MSEFATQLIAWQRQHGRHDLPWQVQDPYRIWLSEIMLQQTQVSTVIPYYQRFLATFPSLSTLALASEEEVLALWSGLGYYARGRNLHRAAQQILTQHQGEFPQQYDAILALPGIGRSTAAAICALAFHERRAILDGNVKRILARYCGIAGEPNLPSTEAQLWQHAEALLPQQDIATYTQAVMDFGATLCTRNRPQCESCPLAGTCFAKRNQQVAALPTPRRRPALPQRQTFFLLFLHQGEILLQQNPSKGLWGGLWLPPQTDDLEAFLTENRLGTGAALAPLQHTFTHFRLHIQPILFKYHPGALPGTWRPLSSALHSAIPTPLRQLLLRLPKEVTMPTA